MGNNDSRTSEDGEEDDNLGKTAEEVGKGTVRLVKIGPESMKNELQT